MRTEKYILIFLIVVMILGFALEMTDKFLKNYESVRVFDDLKTSVAIE